MQHVVNNKSLKELTKQKIKNTKIEKGIDYIGGVEAMSINGEIYNVGSRALAIALVTATIKKNSYTFLEKTEKVTL